MDQNLFINTYIDTIVGTLEEYLKANLQLKTQVKVNEMLIAEKDKAIQSLTQEITENLTAEDWKTKYESAEKNYNAVLGKLKHMDGLFNQIGEMKKMMSSKDAQIELLTNELDELKGTKKVINIKTKKKEDSLPIVEDQPQEKRLDDF